MTHAVAQWLEGVPTLFWIGVGLALDSLYGIARVIVTHFRARRAARRV